MKMKWKLHREQVSGLGLLLSEYLEGLEPDNIQEHWIVLELKLLHHRLWLKGNLMAMEHKTKANISLPLRECYAFALLMERHEIDPTNYIDNLVLRMVNDIKQAAA